MGRTSVSQSCQIYALGRSFRDFICSTFCDFDNVVVTRKRDDWTDVPTIGRTGPAGRHTE